MVKHVGTCLYREARLNLEPAFPGSTIVFTLPTTNSFGVRQNAKRIIITEQHQDQDVEAFTRRHLATDGSLFFRSGRAYPRSILWRMLDSRKVLELQAIDLSHDYKDTHEANLSLLFQFPSPIRPFCVTFCESTERDAITLFAVTTSNELYTINLHGNLFTNPVASEENLESWCEKSEPALFSGRIPYRIVAEKDHDLLVTLDDGAVIRLLWDKTKHAWDGSRYQHSNWSVRGLLSWTAQPTVRFDNIDLAATTAATVAISPDNQHLISVCLDHAIRIWNITSGKMTVQLDILGQINDPRAVEKADNAYYIPPSHPKLLAVLDTAGGLGGATYHIVAYSPKGHQFKVWGVRDADDAQSGLYDVAQGADLIPPIDDLMETTIWTLEEFHFLLGPTNLSSSEIWIRVRSGLSSKVYSIKCDLTDDPDTLSKSWKRDWVLVDSGPLTVESLRECPANPSQRARMSEEDNLEATELWLDFLFYPGRFTIATLETALVIIEKGIQRVQSTRAHNRGSLRERICATMSFLATIKQGTNQEALPFSELVDQQWQAYYSLVRDLHKRRGESLCLAFDHQSVMPWLVQSDYVSSIRSCSIPEITALNHIAVSPSGQPSRRLRKAVRPESRNIGRLLNAASAFRQRLPSFVQLGVKEHVEMDILQSRSLTILDRMEWIEGQTELLQHVSEDDLSLLVEELGTEVKDLNTQVFLDAIDSLEYQPEGIADSKKQITRYGLNALLRVSQEILETDLNTLLDMFVLILFMFVELEGETPEDFDASDVFVKLTDKYKDRMIVSWLASRVWARQSSTGPASEALNRMLSETLKTGKMLPFTQTILEGIHGYRAFELSLPKYLKTSLLTQWSRGWTASLFTNQTYEGVVEDVFGYLLAQREYNLALDFSKFLKESNWASYLKGRLQMALGEVGQAALYFQRPAYGLALGTFNITGVDSANLVTEVERNSFSEGLARYYSHVVGLFEKVKEYSYVMDFARLGLGSLSGRNDELKTDLLQRLFTASIQTSSFGDAYLALVRRNDAVSQVGTFNSVATANYAYRKESDLQTLITSMISQSQSQELLRFPFIGIAQDVDKILLSLCQKTLNLKSGPPYHQILYSFRISRQNFRGAASILHERLQRLKTTSSKVNDPADKSLAQCYLMVINTLSLVCEEDAYILAEQKVESGGPPQWGIGQGKKLLKRQIITLDTLRKEYQAELDRVAAIQGGQFAFVEQADDMDIL